MILGEGSISSNRGGGGAPATQSIPTLKLFQLSLWSNWKPKGKMSSTRDIQSPDQSFSPQNTLPFILSHSLRSYHMPFQEPKKKSEMKGMRGKFLKKLKSIPTINSLKHGLLFQLDPAEKFSNPNHQTLSQLVRKNEDCQMKNTLSAELVFKELKDGDMGLGSNVCKENITPPSMETKETVMEDDIFHDAEDDDELPSLLDFEEKCPPGGDDCVILYSTSVTGVRKTFEDCKAIRFLLESFKVPVYERDLSMHMEFREELWRIFGGRVIPPRLFIKGRYIGGAEEVTTLHEQGKLKKLLEGIPIDLSSSPCTGCANVRFVVCFNCNGSRKVFMDGDHENDELCIRCPECNENGLIKCSICC